MCACPQAPHHSPRPSLWAPLPLPAPQAPLHPPPLRCPPHPPPPRLQAPPSRPLPRQFHHQVRHLPCMRAGGAASSKELPCSRCSRCSWCCEFVWDQPCSQCDSVGGITIIITCAIIIVICAIIIIICAIIIWSSSSVPPPSSVPSSPSSRTTYPLGAGLHCRSNHLGFLYTLKTLKTLHCRRNHLGGFPLNPSPPQKSLRGFSFKPFTAAEIT